MGYVFDAMNRGNDNGEEPVKKRSTPAMEPLPPADLRPPQQQVEEQDLRFLPPDDGEPVAQMSGPMNLEGVDDRLVSLIDPSSVTAEEYRAIRTGLLAKWEHRRHVVHTITSATPQEGKTITSLNLGIIFSELRNRRTIVLEGDLRLPQFAKLLNLPPTPGMVGVLAEEADLNKSIQVVGDNQLHVLPAGRRVNREAVQLLSGARMTAMLKYLRKHYDHIIIDTPPVVELADAGILGAMSDEVLLIARMNRTPRSLIEQAIRTLTGYNAPVAGLVATDQAHHRRRYYYYRYGYRYQYRYYNKAAA